ncbi:hypothetical protein ACP70R_009260 [Stipagrostis hirtigluma subsp. patula]
MEIRLYDNYFWLEYMLSWLSHQRHQLPLPQLFMENQSMDDPLLPLKIRGTITGHQERLPVRMQVKALEAGLAKVKRASIDLIVVLDGSYGAKEMEQKSQKRLQLLNRAKEMEKEHNKAKKMLEELEDSNEKLLKAHQKDSKEIQDLDDQISQIKLEMNKICNEMNDLCNQVKETERVMDNTQQRLQLLNKAREKELEHNKVKKRLEELEDSNKKLLKAHQEDSKEIQDLDDQISQKRLEMNKIRNEMNDLRNQVKETEKVMDNTQQRLQLLNKAMDLVVNKLSDKDRLAIISVPFSITEHATCLLKMSGQGRSEIPIKVNHIVRNLTMASANSGVTQASHRWEQLKKVTKLVRNCFQFQVPTSSSVSSQSQGTASKTTHAADVGGHTNLWNALMDATKILDKRQAEEKDRMGIIIVISDSDDDSICIETLSPNYIIHVFGFRNTRNRALHHIARSSNGVCGILNDERNQITEEFMDCTKNITSIIAVDAKIDLMCSHSSSALLSTIESGHFRHFIDNGRKYSSILIDSLYAGAEMDFMVYLDNVCEQDFDNLAKLLTVRVKWLHALSRVAETLEGEVVFVRNRADIDKCKEVAKDSAHAEAVKIAPEITAPTYN